MADLRRSRGALARLGFLAMLFAAVPQLARAADCGSLESTQAMIAAWGGGTLAPIEDGLGADLRAADYPTADLVLSTPLPGGDLVAVYVVGGRACGVRMIAPSVLGALAALRRVNLSPAGPTF